LHLWPDRLWKPFLHDPHDAEPPFWFLSGAKLTLETAALQLRARHLLRCVEIFFEAMNRSTSR